jgi:hypothetical protein
MDDSWDSASSPDIKKKTSSFGGKSNRSSARSGKYDFPSPAASRRGGNLDESKEFDADILFSPTNSQGSPSATPGDYRNKSYNFDDSPKKATGDYLSNFVLESNELDDSILGGLLGGGAKKPASVSASLPATLPRQRSPQGKLDPIDASDAVPVRASRQSPRRSTVSPPKSFKASSFRGSSPADTGDFDADDDFPISPAFGVKPAQSTVTFKAPSTSFDAPMLSTLGASKGRVPQPSFDVSHDPSFLEELSKPDEVKPPLIKRFTDGLTRPSTSHGLSSETLPPAVPASKLNTTPRENLTPRESFFPAAATSAPEPAPAAAPAADKEDDNVGLAFIPSFMEPGRQNRRRRYYELHIASRHVLTHL